MLENSGSKESKDAEPEVKLVRHLTPNYAMYVAYDPYSDVVLDGYPVGRLIKMVRLRKVKRDASK